MSSPRSSSSPDSKRVRLVSPVKLWKDFPYPNGTEDLIDPDDLPFNDEMFALLDLDNLPGTPPPEANEVYGLMRVDYNLELTNQLIQLTQENKKLHREFEMFREEVNKRIAKVEENNSQKQMNDVSEIAGTAMTEKEHESQNESEVESPDDPEPSNTVPECDYENGGLGPDSDAEVGGPEHHDTVTEPEPEAELSLPVIGSLDEHIEVEAREGVETLIEQVANTNNTASNTRTTNIMCYACKDPVVYNKRRRIIDNEIRDLCGHCSAHIYRVLFPSLYTLTYWGEKPPPQPYIDVPPGIDLEAAMKAARGAGWQRKSPGAAKIKTVLGYDLTEPLLEIIMDIYKEYVEKYPIQQGKTWKYWRRVGFDALQKFDEHFEPSKKHTSLGSVIHDIVSARL